MSEIGKLHKILVILALVFVGVGVMSGISVDSADSGNLIVNALTEPPYPFSFKYNGEDGRQLLQQWKVEKKSEAIDSDRAKTITAWTDPATGLRVQWEMIRYSDFPAWDSALTFENTGKTDTPILLDLQDLDIQIPLSGKEPPPVRLHKTTGAPANPTDFTQSVVTLDPAHPETMGGGGGRSSNKYFPFFKIEMGNGSMIVAVGWSGQWQARIETPDRKSLRVRAGLEKTHFLLHPGEKVRSLRILLGFWEGDTLKSNNGFRQLIYQHYAANREGAQKLPVLFCNTAFCHNGKGGWLNECNAENQISLIKAYGPLGLEALITDAGWFEGGWPAGAGNWIPRKDAYPQGLGPVAEAAKSAGIIYGLWFEPERVVAGTEIHKKHPEWCLASQNAPQDTYLLNFGLPEVREYMFGIVRGFMELPGFRLYRQDFNMDPLPYWRFNDAPDRQGVTEMKYIEGMYAYWDRIAQTWPDSLREECASGGRRIDLETVKRFQMHQKTDYWFDNEVDQSSLWSLSQYLPNNTVVAHLDRMDDYSFHSSLASSLCIGWTPDDPGFDSQRAQTLIDIYSRVRPLLIGDWYPVLPYTQKSTDWIGSQYHRPDLNQGMILVFRRGASPYPQAELTLSGLMADAIYELTYSSSGKTICLRGADLMKRWTLTLPEKNQSELILYHRISAVK